MTIRRVRRVAAGGAGVSAGNFPARPDRVHSVMARGDDPSVTSSGSKYGKAPGVRGAPPPPPSLSEKLRMQELTERRQRGDRRPAKGPISDEDHSAMTSGSGPSAASGWSWATSSRGKAARGAEIGDGGCEFSALRIAAADRAFGEENRMKQRVLSAVNCARGIVERKDENLRGKRFFLPQQPLNSKSKMAKIGLALLTAVAGVVQVGRRRVRRLEELNLASAPKSTASSLSMSDQYLRSPSEEGPSSEGGPPPHAPANGAGGGAGTRSEMDPRSATDDATAFPPHLNHLADLTAPYERGRETPYFWDVHFSGESVAESVFSLCHGLVQACEFGLRQPDYDEDKLGLFTLDKTRYVNVDTTTSEGIERASRLGLASSRLADVVISPQFHLTASYIFSADNPGRMFTLFRHPVDRALGMYYYLQKASWDPHYNPRLAQMTVEQYARSRYIENNWLTRFLTNKPRGKLAHSDLVLAKHIVKYKCLVGLFDDIDASMARFQRYFDWDAAVPLERRAEVIQCRSEVVARGDRNVLGHPVSVREDGLRYSMASPLSDPMGAVRAGSAAWKAIVRMNVYDMELYQYARGVYRVQGEQIFDVVGHGSPLARSPGDSTAAGSVGDGPSPHRPGKGMALDVLAGDVSLPRPGKSMASTAFEDETSPPQSGKSMGLDVLKDDAPSAPSGKSMAVDGFEDGASSPQSGKSMSLSLEDGLTASQPGQSVAVQLKTTASRSDNIIVLDPIKEETTAHRSDNSIAAEMAEGEPPDLYSGNNADGSEGEEDSIREDELEDLDSDVSAIDVGVRKYCQIVYVLGVEGVGHHGFVPVMNTLFEQQVDPDTGIHYERLAHNDAFLTRAIYGRRGKGREVDDPVLVKRLIRRACPNDGARHALILGTSFPSAGFESYSYRVPRQREWAAMAMEEVANSQTALNHPLNLRSFFRAYSPYADVKFVVLHRPFVETLTSHLGYDGGPEQHLNVLSGYLLLIRRFLDELELNKPGERLWTLVCMQRLTEKFHGGDASRRKSAQQAVTSNLASFLGWPQGRCDDCFGGWIDSKRLDSEAQLRSQEQIFNAVVKRMAELNGIWPPTPPGEEEANHQCSL